MTETRPKFLLLPLGTARARKGSSKKDANSHPCSPTCFRGQFCFLHGESITVWGWDTNVEQPRLWGQDEEQTLRACCSNTSCACNLYTNKWPLITHWRRLQTNTSGKNQVICRKKQTNKQRHSIILEKKITILLFLLKERSEPPLLITSWAYQESPVYFLNVMLSEIA